MQLPNHIDIFVPFMCLTYVRTLLFSISTMLIYVFLTVNKPATFVGMTYGRRCPEKEAPLPSYIRKKRSEREREKDDRYVEVCSASLAPG